MAGTWAKSFLQSFCGCGAFTIIMFLTVDRFPACHQLRRVRAVFKNMVQWLCGVANAFGMFQKNSHKPNDLQF
jgi:hypothetical protein